MVNINLKVIAIILAIVCTCLVVTSGVLTAYLIIGNNNIAQLEVKVSQQEADLLTANNTIVSLNQQLAIGATNFSNEDELTKWFVDYARNNTTELKQAYFTGIIHYCMLVQSQSIKDKHLMSINLTYYMMPIAFTADHTYSLILIYDDNQVGISKIDGDKGWYIDDLTNWVTKFYSLDGTGYTPIDIID